VTVFWLISPDRLTDFGKLKSANGSMEKLYQRIETLLNNGVNICGRHYDFLAFSSSQLREHSCWMFAKREGTGVSSETIRAWMGDFQHIHPVAKMAARVLRVLFFERVREMIF